MVRRATLIAFYGESKTHELADYVLSVQQRLVTMLGSTFRSRSISEVHATIIGLESGGTFNSSDELSELRSVILQDVDIQGLCGYVAAQLRDQLVQIQMGGYQDIDYPFTSRGLRLFARTLTANAGAAILIAWPIDRRGVPTDSLDRIRRGAQRFGVVHRYHKAVGDRDPDVYMVIGEMSEDNSRVAEALDEVRAELARSSCVVPLATDSLRIASYTDARLPFDSTYTWPMIDFCSEWCLP